MESLAKEDLIYLAGLFDADGSLGIYSRTRNKKELMPRFNISNTNQDIIYWLKETFGGYITTQKSKNHRHKTKYMWNLNANDCRKLIPRIYLFLKIKKSRAKLLLEFLSLTKNKQSFHHTIEHWEKLKDIKERMEKLNERGISRKKSSR